MKKSVLKIISVAVAFCSVVSLASCKGKTDVNEQTTKYLPEKSVTEETVRIANVPTDTAELTDMLNAAVNYVDRYCYTYKKSLKCDATVTSLGSLSSASNASSAFASIFGEKSTDADFDYNADKKTFADSFVKGSFTSEEISSIVAKQDGDVVVLTAVFNDESNPTDEKGVLHRLGGDYQNAEDVSKSLGEFKSSASSVTVSADTIIITAKISVEDSSLKSMTVSYTERYHLSGVTLVKLSGGSVSGSARTVIEYTDFGQ